MKTIDNMFHIVNSRIMSDTPTRTYSSPIREAQAQQTRDRIVDAALRVLGDRGTGFTMPAVAKAAKVSLPTVYRLFPNKESLTGVASDAVKAKFGIDSSGVDDIDEMLRRQRKHITTASQADERVLRALYTLNASPIEADDLAKRGEYLEGVIDEATDGLGDEDRERFTQMVSIIFSSMTAMSLWRFRLLNKDGADLIDWLVRTLIVGMHANQEET